MSTRPETRRWRPPQPDRILFGAAGGFAVWTAACHATVLAGGGLDTLIVLAALALAAAPAIARWSAAGGPDDGTAVVGATPRAEPPMPAAAALMAGAAAPLLLSLGRPFVAWGVALAAAVLASVSALRPPVAGTTTARSGSQTVVWLLAAAAALVTAAAVRPDIDDALYLNMAVGAADHPRAPLLATDRMHGVADAPLYPPTYRLHSYELLSAAASRLTGVDVIRWAHQVLPPIAALLAVLAWARLARLLAPDRWRIVLLALVAILTVIGNSHAWYGNVGFVRLHQGKCVFVTVAVPLVIAAAARLASGCTRRRVVRLAAAVVASLGLTGTALWVTPALVAVGLVSGGLPRRGGLRPAAAAAAVLLYPALLSAAMLAAVHAPSSWPGRIAAGPAAAARTAADDAPVAGDLPDARPRGRSVEWGLAPMRFAVSYVLGEGALPAVVALVTVGLWWLSPEPRARRLHAASSLLFLAVFFNPLTSLWLSDHVTGRSTYWRGFWMLPVPLLLALALTSPAVRLRRGGRAAAATLTAIVLLGATDTPLLSAANMVRIAPFDLKVPRPEYDVARSVVAAAPPATFVVAPRDVAAWIPTFHHHPYPLVVRRTFFEMLRRAIDSDTAAVRAWAGFLVEAPRLRPEGVASFRAALDRFDVAVVVLPPSNPNRPRLGRILSSAGYEPVSDVAGYTLWQRSTTAPPRERSPVTNQ